MKVSVARQEGSKTLDNSSDNLFASSGILASHSLGPEQLFSTKLKSTQFTSCPQ